MWVPGDPSLLTRNCIPTLRHLCFPASLQPLEGAGSCPGAPAQDTQAGISRAGRVGSKPAQAKCGEEAAGRVPQTRKRWSPH